MDLNVVVDVRVDLDLDMVPTLDGTVRSGLKLRGLPLLVDGGDQVHVQLHA